MTNSSLPMSFKALDRTLRSITEYLAREIAHPSEEPPHWSDIEWRLGKAVMALQGIGAPLAAALRWRGPDHWQSFVEEQEIQGKLRWERMTGLLQRIDRGAQDANIPIIALKGAALYRMGLYPPGERSMGDIDLLAKEEDIEAAQRVIESCEYKLSFSMQRHLVFEPQSDRKQPSFGEHIDNPVKIELHTRIAEPLPVAEVDITRSLFASVLHPGVNDYASPAALMRHLLLHAAGNIRARALRQIQLHDTALLARTMTDENWMELSEQHERRGIWWALSPLALTARYYDGSIPPFVMDAALKSCPAWLRHVTERQQLTDVSWSNIRIEAFPGIEWSKSPLEALHFARRRVVPRRADLAMLEIAVTSLPWAAEIPWYGQSHAVRIARWVFSRPPRVQTLYSVQAALARNH